MITFKNEENLLLDNLSAFGTIDILEEFYVNKLNGKDVITTGDAMGN